MIIIFDGICNLCERSVIFIINRDKASIFKFVQAQSKSGLKLQSDLGINAIELQTIILVKNGKTLFKSDAAIEIAKYLDGAWKLIYVFKTVPIFIRDKIYDYIAKKRYRWFGKKNVCMIPTKQLNERFLN